MSSSLRFLLLLLGTLLAAVLSSPVHGIWMNLPGNEEKRSYFGAYQHIPGYTEEERDKKNLLWFLGDNQQN
ncbi:unnamed protein product, partial [Mesorhabditis belari]|uniref:Uncharacterized protein n=1 Tax=Mesorhabditis belari TaxID=2138241 RepID=A0AAF3J4J4_9BILA